MAEGPAFADKFPITMAEGQTVKQEVTIALVNGALRDQKVLEIILDAAAALLANASNSDEMFGLFAGQVEKNRELAAKMAQARINEM